jgi:FkbM family methyltransferase
MAKRRGLSFSKLLGSGVGLAGRGITVLLGRRIGTRAAAQAATKLMPVVSVQTPRGPLKFWCASPTSAKRAVAFMRHEPDTRSWIDAYVRPGDHLWDVGANVGAYTLYACLTPNVTVTAFEPVAGTFAILARDIEVNGLGARVVPLCLALSSANGIVPIYLSSLEPGAAMHALQEPENVRGKFAAAGVQHIMAMRGDGLCKELRLRAPEHVKIDVDGHELRVIEGLGDLLPLIRTVWIEMVDAADQSGENARIRELLETHGFSEEPFAPAQKGRNRLFVNRSLSAS